MRLYDNAIFSHEGQLHRLKVTPDDDGGTPWDNCDGHGAVRAVQSSYYTQQVPKAPGERVLYLGGRNESTWVYDWSGAMEQAKRDGWGLSEAARPSNWDTLSKGQRAALAVQADFDYLRSWVVGGWHYLGLIVTRMHEVDGVLEPMGESASLFGIESNDDDYITDTAHELAAELAHESH